MTEEQIKAYVVKQFPNDEFKQWILIHAINWATKELEKENEMLRQGYIADKGEWVKRTDVLDKLGQAKKIIKELVRVEYADFTNGDYSNELSKVLEQAEQFLKGE